MAALGAITVVVEAAQPSGSLITARQALELGRELGAVPGPVTSRVSEGTNDLIVDGAAPIRGAQDVLDRLLGVGVETARRCGPPLDAGAGARRRGGSSWDRSTCDAVALARASPPSDAAVALARLELLGYVGLTRPVATRARRCYRARPALEAGEKGDRHSDAAGVPPLVGA